MAWWQEHPNANIGLRTGDAFEVLDIDGPEAQATILMHQPGYRHAGPISATGKGFHLLFDLTGSTNHAKLSNVPLDYRGINGYIVAPPSIHPDGHTYLWKRSDFPLPQVPEWLRLLLFPPPIEKRVFGADDVIAATKDSLPPIEAIMSLLAKGQIRQSGHKNGAPTFQMHCPFHADDTPSMTLYSWDNSFFCHGCRAWGDNLNVKNFLATGSLR